MNPNPKMLYLQLQKSMNHNESGCAHQSDHFDDDNNYNSAPSDFDHYQEDPEFNNGRTGIKEDMVMDQRDQNTPVEKFDN